VTQWRTWLDQDPRRILRTMGRRGNRAGAHQRLGEAEPPFSVLYVYGPGGIDKSSLLDRFAELAGTARCTARRKQK
jgi:hypothetical protein